MRWRCTKRLCVQGDRIRVVDFVGTSLATGCDVWLRPLSVRSLPACLPGWTIVLVAAQSSFACTDRPIASDPLHEMLVAQCERRIRCNCRNGEPDDDCEAYARGRASELREQGLRAGATELDADCAELIRDVTDRVCVEAGIPYEAEALSDDARADVCERFLFHGSHRNGQPCEHPVEFPWLGWSDCEVGSICLDGDDGAKCVTAELARTGSICRDYDAVRGCPVDLVCVDVEAHTGRCLPFTEVGDPCIGFRADHCEGPPGQWCDPDTSTCRAAPGVGALCADGTAQACTTDAFCRDGVCRPRPRPGEACEGHNDCVLGLHCRSGICEGYEACWF